ncbi:hypothetical protein [Dethiosulfatarculus sandiegensis]|uniref:Uncharacterized protein n=1 Tax=Dethiosulfatarculus sandiegensis TaxID=1429043 RepID=A0A0D2J792_9BACT|nr:hypothetical protein [Dethiosulfatarculus sandiegensis]KIX11551.1 hypothetical protein X474_24265 [Dethiosulfatarculus sandiegensis]
MDRKIFEMNLSVNATSLYLLLTSLIQSGADLTDEVIASLWNGHQDELTEAQDELEKYKVVKSPKEGWWQVLPATSWQKP